MYDQLLIRLRTFHIMTTCIGSFFLALALSQVLSNSKGPATHPNPETFSFNFTAEGYIFLFIWLIFMWWAWIPIFEENVSNSKETYLSKTEQGPKPLSQQETHNEALISSASSFPPYHTSTFSKKR